MSCGVSEDYSRRDIPANCIRYESSCQTGNPGEHDEPVHVRTTFALFSFKKTFTPFTSCAGGSLREAGYHDRTILAEQGWQPHVRTFQRDSLGVRQRRCGEICL